MPLSDEKKSETRDRINRDPEFRDEFLTSARNMYMKAMKFEPELANEIDRFEKILGAEPDTYEFENDETPGKAQAIGKPFGVCFLEISLLSFCPHLIISQRQKVLPPMYKK